MRRACAPPKKQIKRLVLIVVSDIYLNARASCFCFSFLFCGYLLERGGFHLLVAVKPWYEERNVYPSHL